jgi:predicted transcriptional regulator
LLLKEGDNLKEAVGEICKKTGTNREVVRGFVKFLREKRLIIVSARGHYGFTVNGLELLVRLMQGCVPANYLKTHWERIEKLRRLVKELD